MTTLARAEVIIGGDDSPLGRALSGAESKMQRAGRKMQAIGTRLSTRVTLPLAAVGAAAFKMAANAEESANKFSVVMGDSADIVRDRLQELGKTIPLTTGEMEKLTAGIQDMLVPLGLARGEAAGMSVDMLELAGDVASFNNVAASQVLEDFQSALAGMSRPLRKYAIDVTEGRLQTLALEEGLIQAGEAMDAASRAQAILIAAQRDSADAVGDAKRTVDSAANSMRFFWRDVKQLAETFGKLLLPIMTPVIRLLSSIFTWLEKLEPATQKWIVGIAGAAAAIGPLLMALGKLITLMPLVKAAVLSGAAPVVLAAAAIGFAAVKITQNWEEFKVFWQVLWRDILLVTMDAVDGLLTGIEKLAVLAPSVKRAIQEAREALAPAFAGALEKIEAGIVGTVKAWRASEDAMAEARAEVKELERQADALADALNGAGG